VDIEIVASFWAMGMTTAFAVWVARSLSRHWARKHQRLLGSGEGVEHLADRVAEVERRLLAVAGTLEDRMTELEERQDFSERVLTQAAREQLPEERH